VFGPGLNALCSLTSGAAPIGLKDYAAPPTSVLASRSLIR